MVFPDSLRGFAEGHYPWDLGPKSMMTNATIAQKVQKVDGDTVNVTYKGGEKKIAIPNNVPIVGLVRRQQVFAHASRRAALWSGPDSAPQAPSVPSA